MFFIKKSANSLLFFIAVSVLSTAMAQSGGLTQINSVFEQVISILKMVSIPVVTIAILWVGYKYLFGGATIRECAPIIIGATLIGAAPYIAGLIVGS